VILDTCKTFELQLLLRFSIKQPCASIDAEAGDTPFLKKVNPSVTYLAFVAWRRER
jgi:hypothetical protein